MGPWLSMSCGTATDRPTHSLPLRNASRKALCASWWIRTQHLADFYWPVQMCADIRRRFIHSNDASNEDYVEPNVMKCPFFWGGGGFRLKDERISCIESLVSWHVDVFAVEVETPAALEDLKLFECTAPFLKSQVWLTHVLAKGSWRQRAHCRCSTQSAQQLACLCCSACPFFSFRDVWIKKSDHLLEPPGVFKQKKGQNKPRQSKFSLLIGFFFLLQPKTFILLLITY